MHDNPTALILDVRLDPALRNDLQTFAFPEGGGIRCRPGFLAHSLADGLLESLRNGVPWTFNVANARNSQSFTIWKEEVLDRHRRGPGKPPLALALEILELTKREAFRRGSDRLEAMGFHRFEDGRNCLSFDGRLSFGTGQFGPAAILSFGASRDLVFKHRDTQRRVVVPVTHGTLVEIDRLTHHQWTIEFPRSPGVREEHISVALHGSTPRRAE